MSFSQILSFPKDPIFSSLSHVTTFKIFVLNYIHWTRIQLRIQRVLSFLLSIICKEIFQPFGARNGDNSNVNVLSSSHLIVNASQFTSNNDVNINNSRHSGYNNAMLRKLMNLYAYVFCFSASIPKQNRTITHLDNFDHPQAC